jgi:hypothetical protein
MPSSESPAGQIREGDTEQPPFLLTIAQELRDMIIEHAVSSPR